MAQLPPKVPNMAPNWLDLPCRSYHQKLPSMENLNTSQSHTRVGDFLSYSSSKHGLHRRSASDSVAFLEPVSLDHEDECKIRSLAPGSRTSHAAAAAVAHEFGKFDEEQFMAIFTDDEAVDLTVACSSPSSPPDHISMEDGLIKQCTTASTDQYMQLESGFKSHSALEGQNAVGDGVATLDNYNDKIFDPRRVKRSAYNLRYTFKYGISMSLTFLKNLQSQIYRSIVSLAKNKLKLVKTMNDLPEPLYYILWSRRASNL